MRNKGLLAATTNKYPNAARSVPDYLTMGSHKKSLLPFWSFFDFRYVSSQLSYLQLLAGYVLAWQYKNIQFQFGYATKPVLVLPAKKLENVSPDSTDHCPNTVTMPDWRKKDGYEYPFLFSSPIVKEVKRRMKKQLPAWVTFLMERKVAILCINSMMRCVREETNGFHKKGETPEVYQRRILSILEKMKAWVEQNKDIEIIAWQEAPIAKEDVELVDEYIKRHMPEWNYGNFRGTSFGVKVLVKNADSPMAPKLNGDLSKKLGDYQNRIQVLNLGPYSKVSNIHVPHGKGKNPTEVKAHRVSAYKMIMREIILDLINTDNPNNEVLQHHVAGDKNLSPDEIIQYVNEVIEKIITEFPEKAININFSYQSSEKGHQHVEDIDSDGKIIAAMLSVDGCLSLELIPEGMTAQAVSESRWKQLCSMLLVFMAGVRVSGEVLCSDVGLNIPMVVTAF